MADIFISYSRKNRAFVERFAKSLGSAGRDLWVDWEDIPWTADWWQEIRTGIENANSFVFVLSPASLSSLVCNMEVAHAIDNQKRVIPVVLETVDAQEARETLEAMELDDVAKRILEGRDVSEVARRNWQYLAQHNWIFFTDEDMFEKSVGNLIQALDIDLDHIHKHTRVLTRAKEWERKARERAFLLRGAELGEAENWLSAIGTKLPIPTPLHTEYILQSRRYANQQQRALLTGVSVALAVMGVLAVLALLLWRQASIERDRANLEAQISRSGRVALQGLLELDEGQLDTALLLGVESVHIYDSREARSSLLTSLQSIPQLDQFLYAHQTWVRSIALRPDEKEFATADAEGKLIFWDATTRQNIGEPIDAHPGGVWEIAYSPDGTLLASVGADGKIRLWVAASRAPAGEFTSDYTDEVFAVVFSPDGTLLATGHADTTVRLWEVDTRAQVAVLQNHTDWVSKVAFSPDGTTLASGGRDALLSLWAINPDAPADSALRLSIAEHTNWVFGLAFHPDGNTLASASADNSVRLWNAATGEAVGRPLTDHVGWVRTIAFSADGTLLVSAGEDRTIILRDGATGRRLRDVPPLVGHGDTVFGITLTADGGRMLSVDQDGSVLAWTLSETQPLSRVFATQPGALFSLAYSGDGTRLVSGSSDGSVQVWDTASGQSAFDPLTAASEGEVITVAISADGATLAYGLADGTVEIRAAAGGDLLHTLAGHIGAARGVAFGTEGTTLATVGDDGVAKLWAVSDGSLTGEITPDTAAGLWALALSPDGATLALGDENGAISLWEVAGRSLERTLPAAHTDAITSLAFSPDGATLASASRDRTVILWDVASGQARGVPLSGHTNWVLDVAFSPDGRMLASSSRDNTLLLWDTASRQPIGRALTGHTDWVWSIAFHPDGTTLASSSRDSTIRLWDVDVSVWMARACAVANRNLDEVESELHLGIAGSVSNTARTSPACTRLSTPD